jgi:hypothetical protein
MLNAPSNIALAAPKDAEKRIFGDGQACGRPYCRPARKSLYRDGSRVLGREEFPFRKARTNFPPKRENSPGWEEEGNSDGEEGKRAARPPRG